MGDAYDRTSKSHHVGDPFTHFTNPWPSFGPEASFFSLLNHRFGRNRNFVKVPDNREGLVKIRKPDWGSPKANESKLRATWIGHASWLVETGATPPDSVGGDEAEEDEDLKATRGIRILFDPLFAERTSPVKFLGPKRYTPTPCAISDLPEIDLVCISHNHYDHLDYDAIKALHARSHKTRFLVPLGLKAWFVGIGVDEHLVLELDWWEGASLSIPASDTTANLVCTPAQHFSARGFGDQGKTLWCSWVLGETGESAIEESPALPVIGDAVVKRLPLPFSGPLQAHVGSRRMFFAGDTGYRDLKAPSPCPAFAALGSCLGPFDLALLPIGLYSPRDFMSSVHCSPEDSVCVHKDIKSKKSIGMHYGTVRGGISAQYEDVLEPPRRWKEACEKGGLKWGEEAGLCDIGETIIID